jgi:O-antigen/teichoic acid export membrane protein
MKRMLVERRIATTSAAMAVSAAVMALLQIASVPFLLTLWGSAVYGVWLTVMAGHMLLRTIDGGFANFVGNEVNQLYHTSQEDMQAALASGLAVSLVLGGVQLAACVLLVVLGQQEWLLGPGRQSSDAGAALVVLGLGWWLSGSVFAIVHRLLIPAGMMYQSTWLALAYQVAQTVVVVIAAWAGASILQAAIAFSAAQVLIYFLSGLYLREKLPALYPWWRGASFRRGLRDLARSSVLTANGMAQQSVVSGVVLLVGGALGTTAVTVLSTTRTLANLWATLGSVVTQPLMPEIIRYHAMREYDKLRHALNAHSVVVAALTAASALAIVPFVAAIYAFWTRGTLGFDLVFFLLLVSAVAVANLFSGLNFYIVGTNHLRSLALLSLGKAAVGIVSALILMEAWGLRGAAAGLLVGEILIGALTATLARHMMREHFGKAVPIAMGYGAFVLLPVPLLATAQLQFGHIHPAMLLASAAWVGAFTYAGWCGFPEEVRSRIALVVGAARGGSG